ncbi:hypothetical protein D3C77_785260 [compost metagenome]
MAHERDGAVNPEKFHFSPSVLFCGERLAPPALFQFAFGFQTSPMEIEVSFFLRP